MYFRVVQHKYLNPELKQKYLLDFDRVCDYSRREYKDSTIALDYGVEGFLRSINKNPNIQTLYSQLKPHEASYLVIGYTQVIEGELLQKLAQCKVMLKNKYGSCQPQDGVQFDIQHNPPKANAMWVPKHPSGLGYYIDPSYWDLWHIRITVRTEMQEKHKLFFRIITLKLNGMNSL